MTSDRKLSAAQLKQLAETGKVTYTPEQLEAQFAADYPRHAFEYGLQYLGVGRFALASFFSFAGAASIHHAVEMFLKGVLAQADDAKTILGYWKTYGHDLGKMYAAVCERHSNAPDMHEFDRTIADLDAFEGIRFPEKLVREGAFIEIGFAKPEPHIPSQPPRPEPRFSLGMPEIDRLVARLFVLADFNPEFFSAWRSERARPFFDYLNQSPLVPAPEKKTPPEGGGV